MGHYHIFQRRYIRKGVLEYVQDLLDYLCDTMNLFLHPGHFGAVSTDKNAAD